MLGLTIIDHEDGSGIDATISGAAIGDVVTLYRSRITGQPGGQSWQAVGGRTGDGTIVVGFTVGYYWWYAASNAPAVSPPVFQPATNGLDDVQGRCIDAVAALIGTLALPGLAGVYPRKVPWDDDLTFPCAVVTDHEQVETVLGQTTGHDEYGHPVYVMFRTNDAHDETAVVAGVERNAGDLIRYWRGKIMRAVQGQRLPGVPESLWCEVEPAQITVLDPAETEVIFSALLIRARTRERRGFGI